MRSTDDHAHHSRQAYVMNQTNMVMPSNEVRGILNASPLALYAPHGARLRIVRNPRLGNYVVLKG